MRFLFFSCLILAVSLDEIRGLNIDFNRLQVLPIEQTQDDNPHPLINSHLRRSLTRRYKHDNDHHSGGVAYAHGNAEIRERPIHAAASAKLETEHKIYKPREDPREFYRSDGYLQEAMEKNKFVSNNIGAPYPGAVVHVGSERIVPKRLKTPEMRSLDRNSRYREWNSIDLEDEVCVKCPAERTLVAKPGVDKVLLQAPHLKTCIGGKAPRGMKFIRKYGPPFGSLLEQGSHMVVGEITYRGEVLRLCRLQLNVVTQLCPVPKYLTYKCGQARGQSCNFTCKNPQLELQGTSSLICGEDLKWRGDLPVCKARRWCPRPEAPAHGRLSCQGSAVGDGGLAEGARCRARCGSGWRAGARAAVCRRGTWHQPRALACLLSRRRPS